MPKSNGVQLSQSFVKGLKPDGRDRKIFDSAIPGFHVRINKGGRMTYALSYRTEDGKQRNKKIAVIGPNTKFEAARKVALELFAEVQNGKDPSGAAKARRNAPRMAQLFEEYLERHARPFKKPRSVIEDETNWRRHLKAAFADRPVDRVTRADVSAFMSSLRETPGAANRSFALLSKMMTLAVEWDYRTDTPCKGVKKYPENQVERFLDPDEAKRLRDALAAEEDKAAVVFFRLLLLTGARRTEALTATWEEMQLIGDRPAWTSPRERVKGHVRTKVDHRRPLSEEAAKMLRDWKQATAHLKSPWVFPSELDGTKHRADFKKAWDRIREAAGLKNFRLHDLRHSYASFAINSGVTLSVIGKSLGHRNSRTTERYAHLQDEAVRAASENVSRLASGAN